MVRIHQRLQQQNLRKGYRVAAVKVNGVDIPLVVKVKSLPAALGPTSVKDVQPVQEQPAEKEKKCARLLN